MIIFSILGTISVLVCRLEHIYAYGVHTYVNTSIESLFGPFGHAKGTKEGQEAVNILGSSNTSLHSHKAKRNVNTSNYSTRAIEALAKTGIPVFL